MIIWLILALLFAGLEALATWKGWQPGGIHRQAGCHFVSYCRAVHKHRSPGKCLLVRAGAFVFAAGRSSFCCSSADKMFLAGLIAISIDPHLLSYRLPSAVIRTLRLVAGISLCHPFECRKIVTPHCWLHARQRTEPPGLSGHRVWTGDLTDAVCCHVHPLRPRLGYGCGVPGQHRRLSVLALGLDAGMEQVCLPT